MKTETTPFILSDLNSLKLEVDNKSNSRKCTKIWRLNYTLLINQWVLEEVRKEIISFLEANESEKTTYQNLWDTAKAVLRGKFIDIKGQKKYIINHLMLHFKLLEKQE
jgi:hypothetical protein